MDRLYRSRDDRMLAGVAGGLAELWDADPSLVRIIWALLVFFTGGIAFLVYIVMAIVVPEGEPGAAATAARQPLTAEELEARRAARAARRAQRGDSDFPVAAVGGLILVGLGAFFLLREFLPEIDFDWVWPLILIGIGVVLLVATIGSRSRGATPPPDAPTPPPATPTADAGAGSTQGAPPPDVS